MKTLFHTDCWVECLNSVSQPFLGRDTLNNSVFFVRYEG